MDNCTTTRIECFEETHSWTIQNWKEWLKINPGRMYKGKHESTALYSEKFNVAFLNKHGLNQSSTWQLKAFPEKNRHGKNSLKLKLVSHNSSNTSIPPGLFDITSDPLLPMGPLVCFRLNWKDRSLENLKAQYPIPNRWPKKHLKINITIKLFVPINIKPSSSLVPDIINDQKAIAKDIEKNYESRLSSKRDSIDSETVHNSVSSLVSSNIPTAPSLMEPY